MKVDALEGLLGEYLADTVVFDDNMRGF